MTSYEFIVDWLWTSASSPGEPPVMLAPAPLPLFVVAQLLPERYQDSDFRDTFSNLIGHEIDRIDSLVVAWQSTIFQHIRENGTPQPKGQPHGASAARSAADRPGARLPH